MGDKCVMQKIRILILALSVAAIMPAFAEDNDEASDDNGGRKEKIYPIVDDVLLKPTVSVQYDKPRIVVKSVYPVISSDTQDENIDHFNQLVSDVIRYETGSFRDKVLTNQSAQTNIPHDKIKNDLAIDFNTSVIKTEGDPIVSIRFTVQGRIAGVSHPYHIHHVLNYDLYNGQEIQLAELFKPDADYLTMISSYSRNVLNRRLKDKSLIEKGTEPVVENFKNWNVSPYGLLFTFDEAQVSPAGNGTQTILIPYSVLKLILAPDSFTNYCAKHRRSCVQNNLLTGGFIDEAALPVPFVA
jgi:hypothetical protein